MITLKKNKIVLSITTFHTIIFLFFLNLGYIGADWDSYALVGTAKLWIENNVYIPSRPPGFPAYELLVIGGIQLQDLINVPFEKIVLSIQYLFLIFTNFLIFKFFNYKSSQSLIFYSVVVLSPIYIISAMSTIDYLLGTYFGFLAIYLATSSKNKKPLLIIAILLSISISMRLSNLIFLFALLTYMIVEKQKFNEVIFVALGTISISSIFYGYFYINLWENMLSSIYGNNFSELFCIFNLTNTDHTLLDRLGRFILKQANYISLFGIFILIYNSSSLKQMIKKDNLIYLIIFLSFQLSFLRLPTEEGHLLPSFIAFFILLSKTSREFKFKNTLLVLVLLSNFVNFNFYKVDQIDSASSVETSLQLQRGQILEDYQMRKEKGQDKVFHYQNSVDTLLIAWKNGCPN